MNEPLHPLIRRLCLAAGAAPAAARRLQPVDPPLRRFESSLDGLLAVSVASRIETLTAFSGGQATLARKLAALEATTPAPPPADHLESHHPAALPRSTLTAASPRLGPRPLPPGLLAEAIRHLDATITPTMLKPQASRAAIVSRLPSPSSDPETRRAAQPLPRPVPLARDVVAQAWRARIEAGSAPWSAWTSPLPTLNASPIGPSYPTWAPQPPDPSPVVASAASPRFDADVPADRSTPRPWERPDLGNLSDRALSGERPEASPMIQSGSHRLEQVLQRLGARNASKPLDRSSGSPNPSLRASAHEEGARATHPASSAKTFASPIGNEPPLRGLRGLAALGERLDAEPIRTAPPFGNAATQNTPRVPSRHDAPPSEAAGFHPAQDLALAMEEVLRQEALRHGIDPRQGLA